FGGENFSVACGLAVGIFLFLENHTEGIAFARVRIEIEIVGKDLREAHCELGRFAGLCDSLKERVVDLSADGADLGFRWYGFNLGGEFAVGSRGHDQHATEVDAVIKFAKFARGGAIDRHRVTSANLAKVEYAL